ncbi:MAG: hypothetical protein HYZ39_04960 [Mycolicibacterium cosmeticum]|nr:hypothetical protein [Mycolicibacterium cosmeticum]
MDFAIDVLSKLLLRLSGSGSDIRVSHAWTDEATMYIVYMAPPSDIVWGLVRDTRSSIVDGAPWIDSDEAALYYCLLDFKENWPGNFSRQPGEADEIRWMGDPLADLPSDPAALPDEWRVVGTPDGPPRPQSSDGPAVEPRRYADPF